MSYALKRKVLVGAVCLGLTMPLAHAQSADPAGEQKPAGNAGEGGAGGAPAELDTIKVTGSRFSDSIATYPGVATVIQREELDHQLGSTNDLGAVLAFSVPGMAASSNTADNVVQALRGRPLRVFIDGIPVSNPLRDGGRDLRLISPNVIESIEVIRGSSAVYGQGGAGGIINYITKTGVASEDWQFRSELGAGFSTEHYGDSLAPSVYQSATGMLGDFDVIVEGSYEQTQGQFDADGERLPPDPHDFGGIADSDIYSFFGKIGYTFDEGDQRLELMGNVYDQEQDSDYIRVNGSIPQGIPASAIKGAYDPRAANQENRNRVFSLTYYNFDVLGGTLTSKAYYLKNFAMFSYNPTRFGGSQALIESTKKGLQTDLRTPLSFLPGAMGSGDIMWGADLSRDTTLQPLIPNTYAAGDGRTYSPPMQQDGYAGFAQLRLPLTDWLTLNAGVRHDSFKLDIDPFVSANTRMQVSGGSLDYSATPYNIGANIRINDALTVFGGLSQGFSVPDVGLPMRNIRVPTLDGFKPKAQLVDNYELGVRGELYGIHYEASYYLNKADYGTDFVINALNPGEATTLREKEEVHGWEVSLDGYIGEATKWSLSYAESEGRRDANHDGDLDTPLSNRRIGPPQLNAMVEYEINPDWYVRVQGNRSGSRNAFPTAPVDNFYTGKIEPTNRIDLSSRYKFNDSVDLTVGVNNLFNKDYYSVTSQLLNRNALYVKAEGRTVYLKLGVNY